MTVINPERTLANQLIALKSQYEQALTEADAKATHLKEQLSHVNALLLNQLVPSATIPSLQAHIESSVTALALPPQREEASADIPLDLTLEEDLPQRTKKAPKAKQLKEKAAKVASKPTQSSRKGSSQTLLPAFQGLKRLEAIAQVLDGQRGKEVTIDSLTQSLFGDLSTAEHKKERLRLKTLLYQGVKLGLWQKAATPSSYLSGASTGKGRSKKNSPPQPSPSAPAASIAVETKPSGAKKTPRKAAQPRKKAIAQKAPTNSGTTPTTKKRNSLPLLPVYQGVTKLEAIRSVLQSYAGEDLHHDTIIQSLYGDLSPADLKAERVRIKTALLTGVKNKLWGKSPKPSTYRLDALNPPSESNGKGASGPASQFATKAPAAKGRKKPVAAKPSTKATASKPSRRKAK
jgi:hypothetical protein